MTSSRKNAVPLLSKSRFVAGLQCPRRLYLECFNPDLADPVSPAEQARLDMGTRVGGLARDLYPGATLIAEPYFQHEEAVASTLQALSGMSAPALCEAAFLHDGVRVRVDILARAAGGEFDLVEVKSTTSVKDEHVPDVAVQLYVLNGKGVAVRNGCLAHLNKDYVYPGGGYDVSQLFLVEDISGDVYEALPGVPSALEEMRRYLAQPEPPQVRPGRQCTSPYPCQFYGHCHTGGPEHPVIQLPRASRKLLDALAAAGIEDIRDIPAGFPGLNVTQRLVRDCVIGNRFHLDQELPHTLARLEHPVHFLDFETFNPALPLYAGTRPYQVIPFQWSCHTMMGDGSLEHREFLHDGFDDPRGAFAESLLAAVGDTGPILTYSGFEAKRIEELARYLPHLAGRLLPLLDGRIVDLLQLVRRHCYHPGFHGSFSLKAVLPALVPDLGYDDLDITEGDQASLAYAEMILPDTTAERRQWLREGLLAYCKRDTEAMVRLFDTLKQ
ncbi:MAG: DUF2779 domain-containing protein [Chloroflexota bacterium]|nr:DUF2779 domain-containing protein [Chloroflexota bacterium]